MVNYKKVPSKDAHGQDTFRYLRGNKFIAKSRIPHEVMEKFELIDTVDYDDAPERRRCVLCEAPQSRIRSLNMTVIDLCDWHYQNTTLGELAHQVALLQKEQAKVKPAIKKKKRKSRKTALSNML